MEVKNKKVNPFILFINTLVNGGEDVKDEKLPKELEDSLKSIDADTNKFFANLQAPVKKSSKKSLDDDLKVETKKVEPKKVEPKKSVRNNTEKQIDAEREQ